MQIHTYIVQQFSGFNSWLSEVIPEIKMIINLGNLSLFFFNTTIFERWRTSLNKSLSFDCVRAKMVLKKGCQNLLKGQCHENFFN